MAGIGLEAIAPHDPVSPPTETAAQFITPGGLHPKTHDIFVFHTTVLCGIVIFAGIAAFWRTKRRVPVDPRAVFLVCILLVATIAFQFDLGDGLLALFAGTRPTKTVLCALLAGIIAWASTTGKPTGGRNYVLLAAFVLFAAFIVSTRLFNDAAIIYTPHIVSHYEAVVYSIAHVAGGGTCLADVLPQYGCYGEFLAPLIRYTGVTPFAATTVLAVLQLAAMLAIFVFSSSLIEATALVIAAFGCIVILTSLTLVLGSPDPYFQYNPIRLLFPALSLLAVLAIQQRASWPRITSAGLLAGAALAWNLDSGVAVFGALGAFVFAMGFTAPRWLSQASLVAGCARVAWFLAGSLGFLAAFALYLEVKSGWTVDLAAAIAYPAVFYGAGFAMIPTPSFPDVWAIAVIIISLVMMVLLLSVSGPGKADPRLERAAYLAVLAVGLMLYYAGRSHWLVLRFVVWPEVILFFFLTDRAIAVSSRATGVAVISASIFLPLAATVAFAPILKAVIHNIWTPSEQSALFQEDVNFLRSLTTPGERVAIVAENQTTLYAAIGSWPFLRGPSLAEMQLIKDRDALREDIATRGPKKLFVNSAPSTLDFFARQMNLATHYNLVQSGPEGRLLYFVRRD